ncbi:hypothetical protein RRG08_049087 [Elysia crispata]|uniref:Uncharacterized protein n=1 Tax=Elysia crispata TaxID=231223 RepID=A0AAE1AAE6_9GAST|nr:hypothetical protein RRG08_049087 [Elysia crispata]
MFSLPNNVHVEEGEKHLKGEDKPAHVCSSISRDISGAEPRAGETRSPRHGDRSSVSTERTMSNWRVITDSVREQIGAKAASIVCVSGLLP